MAGGAVDFTNNAVIPMAMPGGGQQLLLQYGTQNNPSLVQHGRILQRISSDDGHTCTHTLRRRARRSPATRRAADTHRAPIISLS
jgi:hypothetical protein